MTNLIPFIPLLAGLCLFLIGLFLGRQTACRRKRAEVLEVVKGYEVELTRRERQLEAYKVLYAKLKRAKGD
jgi:hypothetical protein